VQIIDELENYNIFKVDRSKKEQKFFVLQLNCDLTDLKKELDAIVVKDD